MIRSATDYSHSKRLSVFAAICLVALFFTTPLHAFIDSPKTSTVSNDLTPFVYSGQSDIDPERLNLLIEHFRRNGVTGFEEKLDDERFELYDGIGNRFRRSAERRSLNLEEYKQILGYEDKRNRIAAFISEHEESLSEAEREYDISKYVIAAILGIESDFGRNIGSFNPFNAYVSMYAEDYRSDFALEQLEHLVQFVQRNDVDVFELRSSYAGAMSFAQFIPYSLNRWFVGDDIFDMHNNIMSIGNYLRHFKNITGTMDGAVMRYNPSRLYTDAVLSLAADAEELHASR